MIKNLLKLTKGKKNFSTAPAQAASPNAQNTAVSDKSPEQMKIDSLMAQWPEYLRNPKPFEFGLIELKDKLEKFYRFYNPDKAMIYEWEKPRELDDLITNPEVGNLTGALFEETLKQYKGFLNTEFVFERFHKIAELKDAEKGFYEVVIPIIKHNMTKFDRNSIDELYNATAGAAKLNLADKEFWGIIEQKLIGEKLYRYLSLEQCVLLAIDLNKAEKGSISLLKAIEVNLIKHRKALHMNKYLLKKAKLAYANSNSGSNMLKAALEDPDIEVPGVDIEIPVMSLKKENEKQIYEKKLLH